MPQPPQTRPAPYFRPTTRLTGLLHLPHFASTQLTGHFHAGGAVKANGVHYVTYEGLVEAPPGSNSYAIVEVGDNKISIRGGGYGASRDLKIAPAPAKAQAPEP